MMSSDSDDSSDHDKRKCVIQVDDEIKGYSDNFTTAIDYLSKTISTIVDNFDKDYFVFAEEKSDTKDNFYFIKIVGRHRYMCNPGFHTRPLSFIKMELINAL